MGLVVNSDREGADSVTETDLVGLTAAARHVEIGHLAGRSACVGIVHDVAEPVGSPLRTEVGIRERHRLLGIANAFATVIPSLQGLPETKISLRAVACGSWLLV